MSLVFHCFLNYLTSVQLSRKKQIILASELLKLPLPSPLLCLHSSWLSDGHLLPMYIADRRGWGLIKAPLETQGPKSSGHARLPFVFPLLFTKSHYIYAAGSSESQMPAATDTKIYTEGSTLVADRHIWQNRQRMVHFFLSDGSLWRKAWYSKQFRKAEDWHREAHRKRNYGSE